VRPTLATMELNDIPSSRGQDPLVGVEQQDLTPLSVAELRDRAARLKEEVERTEARLVFAQQHLTNADAIFRKN